MAGDEIPQVRFGGRTIQTIPGPSGRLREGSYSGAFGEQVGQSISPFGAALMRRATELAAKREVTAATNAYNQGVRRASELMYGPGGMLSRKGEDSYGVHDDTAAELRLIREEVSSGLTSESARTRFGQSWMSHETGLLSIAAKYEESATDQFQDDSLVSAVALQVDHAIKSALSPDVVEGSVAQIEQLVEALAHRRKLSPESREVLMRTAMDKTYKGVINSVAESDPALAEVYLETLKDRVSGEAYAELKEQVKGSSRLAQAQALENSIAAKFSNMPGGLPRNLTKANQYVRETVKDPKLVDAVIKRLSVRAEDAALEEAVVMDTAVNSSYEIYKQTGDMGSALSHLPLDEQATMEAKLLQYRQAAMAAPIRMTAEYNKLIELSNTEPFQFARTADDVFLDTVFRSHGIHKDRADEMKKHLRDIRFSILRGEKQVNSQEDVNRFAGVITNMITTELIPLVSVAEGSVITPEEHEAVKLADEWQAKGEWLLRQMTIANDGQPPLPADFKREFRSLMFDVVEISVPNIWEIPDYSGYGYAFQASEDEIEEAISYAGVEALMVRRGELPAGFDPERFSVPQSFISRMVDVYAKDEGITGESRHEQLMRFRAEFSPADVKDEYIKAIIWQANTDGRGNDYESIYGEKR